jgi:hypothetical protein
MTTEKILFIVYTDYPDKSWVSYYTYLNDNKVFKGYYLNRSADLSEIERVACELEHKSTKKHRMK